MRCDKHAFVLVGLPCSLVTNRFYRARYLCGEYCPVLLFCCCPSCSSLSPGRDFLLLPSSFCLPLLTRISTQYVSTCLSLHRPSCLTVSYSHFISILLRTARKHSYSTIRCRVHREQSFRHFQCLGCKCGQYLAYSDMRCSFT